MELPINLQVEPIKKHHISKYQSIHQTFWLILKEEGVTALWKGHIPAQLLSIMYGTGSMYSYNVLMEYYDKYLSFYEQENVARYAAGACAGSVGTIVSFPFDTIRTRLVAQSNNNQVYKGVIHSCSTILRHESPKVFFFGLSPTLLQIAPHSGFQFLFYDCIKNLYKKCFDQTEIHFYNSMISGSIAGLMAKTIVYPLDLARKRLQIQGFEHARKRFGKFFKCSGLVDCLTITLKEEGLKGLFKGLVPSQLKAALTTALHFTFYEQALLIIRST
ncbi:hypothetical protein KPH14_007365 [Odynerus spinipes]|uniref:Mitochondrial thiamine pyrophosphate carrier n=1 Tax=Odynerus spinipes TaxID=1348599 RepID=A0AAD9RBJ4_9HYME|nr:hypothetical protein KPH14_007365 [Odynerus spinipes]